MKLFLFILFLSQKVMAQDITKLVDVYHLRCEQIATNSPYSPEPIPLEHTTLALAYNISFGNELEHTFFKQVYCNQDLVDHIRMVARNHFMHYPAKIFVKQEIKEFRRSGDWSGVCKKIFTEKITLILEAKEKVIELTSIQNKDLGDFTCNDGPLIHSKIEHEPLD